MLTFTLKENKTLNNKKINDLLSFFNNNDLELETISRKSTSNTRSKKTTIKCLYSKQKLLNLNKKIKSNYLKKLSTSNLDDFINKFKPTMTTYSNRSVLLKSAAYDACLNKKDSKWNKVESPDLNKPLYFNKTLNGWISSLSNKTILENKLYNEISYNDELSDLSDTETYDELIGLKGKSYKKGLLIKPNVNDNRIGEKYFHGGWWNDTLKGWVFSSKLKNDLINKGVHFS
jgi:hypothetical protein